MQATRTIFLAALRSEIVARYPWASDTAKVDSFIAKTRETIETERNVVMIDTPAFIAAYRTAAPGSRGRVTYKALRELQDA